MKQDLPVYPEVRLMNHKVVLFLIVENLYAVFHNDCTSLHCHPQCSKVLLSPWPHQRLLILSLLIPGEGNGNALQYSCLENSLEPGGSQFMGLQRVRHD